MPFASLVKYGDLKKIKVHASPRFFINYVLPFNSYLYFKLFEAVRGRKAV